MLRFACIYTFSLGDGKTAPYPHAMSGHQLRLSPSECTCFRLRGAARRITQIYVKRLAPTGLKISQFSLLGFIIGQGPVGIGRLSELLVTDRTTLTRNLRPLLASGLIERAASGDKRRRELMATAAGRALFKRALPLWTEAEKEVRAAMGGKLTADLHGAIDRSMERLAAL
jgi:DNA-binding MarR family transcriptional regulator